MQKGLQNSLFIFFLVVLLLSGAHGLSKGDGGGISVREEGKKLGVTLGLKSSTGKCAVNGIHFSSLDYGDNEMFAFTTSLAPGTLNDVSLNTEGGEKLYVGWWTQYERATGQQVVEVAGGKALYLLLQPIQGALTPIATSGTQVPPPTVDINVGNVTKGE